MVHKIIGIIPARFASTRFPGKPLALIAGKSLIQRTYENALRCPLLDEVIVATDDVRIMEHTASFGGKSIITSPNCLTGTDRLAETVRKNRNSKEVEIVVNIQGDEPLLEPEVIEEVVENLRKSPEAVMATAVMKIVSETEAYSRSVNKCVFDCNGYALYFSRSLIPGGHFGKWGPKTPCYKHLGIYSYRREFLYHYAKLDPTPLQVAEDLEQLKVLEHGYRMKVAIVQSQSIGVDKPEDIIKIERMLKK